MQALIRRDTVASGKALEKGGNATVRWGILGKALTLRWWSLEEEVKALTLRSDPYDRDLGRRFQTLFNDCSTALDQKRLAALRGERVEDTLAGDPEIEEGFRRRREQALDLHAGSRERAMRDNPW